MVLLVWAVAFAPLFPNALVEGRAIEANGNAISLPRMLDFGSELTKRTNVTAVYLDKETHSLVFTLPPGHSKRDSEEDHIRSLLRSHNSHDFCKAYCEADYNPQPTTVYYTATKLTTVTKSKTTTLKGSTTTKSVSGSHSAVSTLLRTSTIVTGETLTTDAPLVTIGVEATSIVSVFETLTTDAPTQTVTEYVLDISTEIDTITGDTITSTENIPVPTILPRNGKPAPPSWLSSHSGPKIQDACKKIFPPPARKTATCTVVKYVSISENDIVKVGGHTVTTTVSIVQPASTITTSDYVTLTSTATKTFTPVTTLSETTLTTQSIIVLETNTPSITESLTSLTTTTTTTTAPGSIVTACQSATSGLSGGGVIDNVGGASLNAALGSTAAECCNSCYTTPGCSGWLFFNGLGCYIGVESSGGAAPTSGTCPAGRGEFELFTGGDAADVGGPGPCITTLEIS